MTANHLPDGIASNHAHGRATMPNAALTPVGLLMAATMFVRSCEKTKICRLNRLRRQCKWFAVIGGAGGFACLGRLRPIFSQLLTNVLTDVARKRALEGRDLIPATFWICTAVTSVFAIVLLYRIAGGAAIVIRATRAGPYLIPTGFIILGEAPSPCGRPPSSSISATTSGACATHRAHAAAETFIHPSNIRVDEQRAMHLRISKTEKDWSCAEASMTRDLGYGPTNSLCAAWTRWSPPPSSKCSPIATRVACTMLPPTCTGSMCRSFPRCSGWRLFRSEVG